MKTVFRPHLPAVITLVRGDAVWQEQHHGPTRDLAVRQGWLQGRVPTEFRADTTDVVVLRATRTKYPGVDVRLA